MFILIGVLVVVVGSSLLGHGKSETGAGPKASNELFAQERRAQDESAKSLVRNGAIAMESLLSEAQSLSGAISRVGAIEPNIHWVSDPQARAANGALSLTVGPDQQSYVLTTASSSGTTFTYSRGASFVVARTCGPGCTW